MRPSEQKLRRLVHTSVYAKLMAYKLFLKCYIYGSDKSVNMDSGIEEANIYYQCMYII